MMHTIKFVPRHIMHKILDLDIFGSFVNGRSYHILKHQCSWIQAQIFNLIQSLLHIQHEAHKNTTWRLPKWRIQNLKKSLKSVGSKSWLEANSIQNLNVVQLPGVHWSYWNQNQALKPPKSRCKFLWTWPCTRKHNPLFLHLFAKILTLSCLSFHLERFYIIWFCFGSLYSHTWN